MSKIKNLSCFYSISEFNKHIDIKEILLKYIDKSTYKSPKNNLCEVDITKTDWEYSTSIDRAWVQYILQDLSSHISKTYKEIGYGGFTLNEIWFQQYLKNSKHGWHTHSGNFTNVYYLELPKDSPKTILIEPFTKNKIEVNVSEGDILFFPSFILHKSPPNNSNDRKTIISYNTNVTYPDEFYGQGL